MSKRTALVTYVCFSIAILIIWFYLNNRINAFMKLQTQYNTQQNTINENFVKIDNMIIDKIK